MEKSRIEFVSEVLADEKNMSQLCREYEITRKTGYKWLERARAGESLKDQSHCPKNHPNKTPKETEELILETRIKHPAWGARKLKKYLENQGHINLPVQSTICEILKRNGMIVPEESQIHTAYKRFEKEKPNEMWQVDFKGDFGLLDTSRCHPLTVLDDHSRFSLCLEAKKNQQAQGVFKSFQRLFEEYGLPHSILSDNGSPWGDSKSGSYTMIDLWMMQLDILPIHGRPLHPQTQGKEERFHRTLKDELLKRELFENMTSAQKRFDSWRYEYNYERPHSAIDLQTPSKRYKNSNRKYPDTLKEPEYDDGVNLRCVNYKGYISVNSHRYYLSEVFNGKVLRVMPTSEQEIILYYGKFHIAKINLDEQIFTSRRIYRITAEN